MTDFIKLNNIVWQHQRHCDVKKIKNVNKIYKLQLKLRIYKNIKFYFN